jgi:protein-L-isoaspartate(D-aspartate) O-methyltransferase
LRGLSGAPYKRASHYGKDRPSAMSVDFAQQRAAMVESQVRVADVTDYAIQDAMRATLRERCLPPDKAYLAYADMEVEYAPGRWLLKPRDVAKLLQALRPRAGERALAIAAPYAAAVMEAMGLHVTRLEGEELTAPEGDYDVVISEGAVTLVPSGWLGVLAETGGRLGVVVREGPIGRARLYLRTPKDIGCRDLFDCAPPLMAGFEPKRAFAF